MNVVSQPFLLRDSGVTLMRMRRFLSAALLLASLCGGSCQGLQQYLPSGCKPTLQNTSFLGPVRHLVSQDGVDWGYYDVSSNGTRNQTLILITGYKATTRDWSPALLKGLSQYRRLVVPDNPGVGFTSDFGNASSSFQAAADAYLGLIEELGLASPDVLGWSMGGQIAATMLTRFGDQLGSVIISSADAGGPGRVKGDTAALTAATSPLALIQALFPNTTAGQQAACAYAGSVGSMPADDISAAAVARQDAAEALWNQQGVESQLPGIVNPVLIIQGLEDIVQPAENSDILSRIPHSSLIRFPGAGHGVLFQETPSVLAYIGAFLSQPLP